MTTTEMSTPTHAPPRVPDPTALVGTSASAPPETLSTTVRSAPPAGPVGQPERPWARAVRGASSAARYLVDLVTPLGAVLIGLGVVSWTAASALRWVEAAVVALTVTGTLVVALAFVIGRLQYSIELDLSDRRVVVGDRAYGRVVVRNDSGRPLSAAAMELQVGQGTATFRIPRLAPGAVHEEVFAVPTHRRAVILVGPVRTVRADPLGLLRRELTWSEPHELFVHPRAAVLGDAFVGRLRDLEGRVTPEIADADISFHALREYAPGDDLRHVHWRSTARTGQIMVRQFEETRRSRIAVVLSTRHADYADPEEFELAVSVCASLGLQAIREDGGLAVLVPSGRVRGDHRTRLLDDLTRLEPHPVRQTLASLAQQWTRSLADVSVVAVVAGSQVAPAELRSASVWLPADARLFAVLSSTAQDEAETSVSWGRVGDLDVLTVGTLDDLAGALRRMSD